jgi:hypothetical protein
LQSFLRLYFGEDFPSSESEQQSFEWLVYEDLAMLAVGGSNEVQINDSERMLYERYVAALFYYETGGADWDIQTQWLSIDRTCDWYGLSCSDWEGILAWDHSESFQLSSCFPLADSFRFFSKEECFLELFLTESNSLLNVSAVLHLSLSHRG